MTFDDADLDHLEAQLSDTVPPGLADVPFTGDSLPAGEHAEKFWQLLLGSIEEQVHRDGWDQPAYLWWLAPPVVLAAMSGDVDFQDIVNEITGTGPGETTVPYGIFPAGELHGNPREALAGITAPQGATAAIALVEAWITEQPDSDNPTKVEARYIVAATAAGEVWQTFRIRGQDRSPDLERGESGLISLALLRTLGVDAATPTSPSLTVRQFIARSAVAVVAEAVTRAAGDDPSAQATALRSTVAQAHPDEREMVWSFTVTTMAVTELLLASWHFTHGLEATRAHFQSNRPAGTAGALDELIAKAPEVTRQAFSTIPTETYNQVFPEYLHGHSDWAGEHMLGFVAGNRVPDLEESLRTIADIAGPVAETTVRELLAALDWA